MSETQELQPSSEFEIPLADIAEPDALAPRMPRRRRARYVPVQPLPRLWKTEPDPEEDSEELPAESDKKKGARRKADTARESSSPSQPKATASRSNRPKPKKKRKVEPDENGEKRVLLEETPALDTIESRAAGPLDDGRADDLLRLDLRLDRLRHDLLGLGRSRRGRRRDAARAAGAADGAEAVERALCALHARPRPGVRQAETDQAGRRHADEGRLGLQGDAGGRRGPGGPRSPAALPAVPGWPHHAGGA